MARYHISEMLPTIGYESIVDESQLSWHHVSPKSPIL
jgi:hypothetical protein